MQDAPALFEVEDLCVSPTSHGCSEPHETISGLNLTVGRGEVHAVIDTTSASPSALASALMGGPGYRVTRGHIRLNGDDITRWGADVRAKAGLFLATTAVQEIPGVTTLNIVRQALGSRSGINTGMTELQRSCMDWMRRLNIADAFATRCLNEGATRAEKKRIEILQMAMLEPDLAILDESDPAPDVEAFEVVARGVTEVCKARPELAILAITNHTRLLDFLRPAFVHLLADGRVVASGGPELARTLANEGHDNIR